PAKLTRAGQRGVIRTEPMKRADESGHPFAGDDLSSSVAGRSSGEERQDSRPPALFLVGLPTGADGERRAEGARLSRRAPELAVELQQRLGAAAVLETNDG